MRLIVHNMLQCHVKGCDSNNFPLQLSDVELEIHEIEYNHEFLQSLLTKLDWKAFVATAEQIGITSLPQTFPEEIDEDFLKKLHRILFETHIVEGKMICSNCSHEYPIRDGIPNMLLNEEELE
ncbi:11764_t:CDS:2 [Dentiscutata erythropus]|uniref:11764_t:CDS:1 n=1 Tax=Dentiscutata erythropus TaxID=1348616 RepID=A0A9N9I7G2_9GLOM|nr:11764_t:CDS:2 [Dentiscutata erythropus]